MVFTAEVSLIILGFGLVALFCWLSLNGLKHLKFLYHMMIFFMGLGVAMMTRQLAIDGGHSSEIILFTDTFIWVFIAMILIEFLFGIVLFSQVVMKKWAQAKKKRDFGG